MENDKKDNVMFANEAKDNHNPINSTLVQSVLNGNDKKIEDDDLNKSNGEDDTKKQNIEDNKNISPENLITQPQPTNKISELEDKLLEDTKNINTPNEWQETIASIRKQYEDLAKKQKEEYNEELKKMQDIVEQQKQKEIMAGMSEKEKTEYVLNLKIKELQEKIVIVETRNKDLEDKLEKQNNEKYISDRVQENPYIKDSVARLNVKTKDEYENKIVPILGQLKELEELKSQNQLYGNKNAFAGYGTTNLKEDSDAYKKVKAYSSNFLQDIIKK